MNQITISKKEYAILQKQAKAYKDLISKIFEFAIKDPINEIVEDFRKTDLYTEEFLSDSESGLRKSSYVQKLR